jgi:hypothetical protein
MIVYEKPTGMSWRLLGFVALRELLSHPQSVCSCPRCHMPHAHNGQRGSHQCRACGLMLHQKKERTLIRQRDKGRGLERSL